MFCQGHGFSSGLRHFQEEGNYLRTSLAMEGPELEKVARIRNFVLFMVVRMIEVELNLNHTTDHQILTNELGTRKMSVNILQEQLDGHVVHVILFYLLIYLFMFQIS